MSELRYDLVIRGGTCVTPAGALLADLGVRHGVIATIGDLDEVPCDQLIDGTGLHILPGVIDSHVHFREPGHGEKEDLATGTAAAVLGGVTSVIDMPNTDPPTVSAAALLDKIKRLRGRARCDVGFFIGATPENLVELGEIENLPGCAGVKVFMGSSTGSLLLATDEFLAMAMTAGHRRIAIHAEDENRLRERRHIAEDSGDVRLHPEWRDTETALQGTWRALALARRFGRRVHILHVSTADELKVIADCRDIATAEVTPQHLTLVAPGCYERFGTRAQMNPPIRGDEHRVALWEAVRSGLVDIVASDHAPHTMREKELPYPKSPSGMPGVQTMLPVMLNHVSRGELTIEQLVDVLSSGPARIWGIAQKGRLAVGYDADLAVVDLTRQHTLRDEEMASRCGWTPFAGMTVTGMPVATILRGRVVMRDGKLVGDPMGRELKFLDTIEPQASAL